MSTGNKYLLELKGVNKKFPGVHALKSVDFELMGGECVALLGENGAGKSTLIKVMGGAHQADSGSLEVDGVNQYWEKPTDSLDAGVAIIYQEFLKHLRLVLSYQLLVAIVDYFPIKAHLVLDQLQRMQL